MYIVHTESSCGWGGQEIRILNEATGMIDRGHHVEIWAPSYSYIFSEAKDLNIPVHPIQIDKRSLRTIFIVKNKIARSSPDIINTHSSSDSWVISLACAILQSAPPCIRTRHISAKVNNKFTTRWLYTKAMKHIAVTGDAIKQDLVHNNGFPEDMITSVPTGVDIRIFHPGNKTKQRKKLGLTSHKYIIGIIATLRSWKGHDDLLDAIILLKRDDILFIIVGDGPRRSHLEQKARNLNIDSNKLLFVGQQQNVVPWFQAMDISILPSYANEGVPQSLIQAMACGIPVISTPVGSIEELVINKITGTLIQKNSPQDICTAINDLIDNPKTQKQLIKGGLRHIQTHYTLDIMLNSMEKIFNHVVNQDGQ